MNCAESSVSTSLDPGSTVRLARLRTLPTLKAPKLAILSRSSVPRKLSPKLASSCKFRASDLNNKPEVAEILPTGLPDPFQSQPSTTTPSLITPISCDLSETSGVKFSSLNLLLPSLLLLDLLPEEDSVLLLKLRESTSMEAMSRMLKRLPATGKSPRTTRTVMTLNWNGPSGVKRRTSTDLFPFWRLLLKRQSQPLMLVS